MCPLGISVPTFLNRKILFSQPCEPRQLNSMDTRIQRTSRVEGCKKELEGLPRRRVYSGMQGTFPQRIVLHKKKYVSCLEQTYVLFNGRLCHHKDRWVKNYSDVGFTEISVLSGERFLFPSVKDYSARFRQYRCNFESIKGDARQKQSTNTNSTPLQCIAGNICFLQHDSVIFPWKVKFKKG